MQFSASVGAFPDADSQAAREEHVEQLLRLEYECIELKMRVQGRTEKLLRGGVGI